MDFENNFHRLASIASSLDAVGLYEEADHVGRIMARVAQKYTGQQLVNNLDPNSIKKWQQYLVSQGHKIAVDGVFGPATTKATTIFQRAKGIGVDGLVGPATLNAAGILNQFPSIARVSQFGQFQQPAAPGASKPVTNPQAKPNQPATQTSQAAPDQFQNSYTGISSYLDQVGAKLSSMSMLPGNREKAQESSRIAQYMTQASTQIKSSFKSMPYKGVLDKFINLGKRAVAAFQQETGVVNNVFFTGARTNEIQTLNNSIDTINGLLLEVGALYKYVPATQPTQQKPVQKPTVPQLSNPNMMAFDPKTGLYVPNPYGGGQAPAQNPLQGLFNTQQPTFAPPPMTRGIR